MAGFTVYRFRFSEKASGRLQVSHSNELSSRVEMRHRADAVFHVSIPYVHSLAARVELFCFTPRMFSRLLVRVCVRYVCLCKRTVIRFLGSLAMQIPLYVRDTRARDVSREGRKISFHHTRDGNVFI